MSFSNLDHLYSHLPARFRRDDDGLFLQRFLSWFGGELDDVDEALDSFYTLVAGETAPEVWVNWWLSVLFGWNWLPAWLTLDMKRAFYQSIGVHYARRGTAYGIREFLLAFGIQSYVDVRPRLWGEALWGENRWSITGPLGFVVRIMPTAPALTQDECLWGESPWSEAFGADVSGNIRMSDVEELLRFQWPLSQVVLIDVVV